MTGQVHALLQEGIARAVARSRDVGRDVLVSLSLPLAPTDDPLARLACLPAAAVDAFLWQRPSDKFSLAGAGVAAVCRSKGESRFVDAQAFSAAFARDALRLSTAGADCPGPIFTGGFAFSPEVDSASSWAGFPAGRLVVPRWLLAQRDGRAVLTATVTVAATTHAAQLADSMVDDLERLKRPMPRGSSAAGAADPDGVVRTPSDRDWCRAVALSVDDIRAARLEKIVLARRRTVRASCRLDDAAVARRLLRRYPDCTTFLIRTPAGSFVGATPERLVAVDGLDVRSVAVAGSSARSADSRADAALGRTLLHDRKERHEHELVRSAIAAILGPLCAELQAAPCPALLRLPNVQHLVTRIDGRLKAPRHVLDLVARLHPSPAVGGFPRRAALNLLRERETIDRGWYAGPVGWVDAAGNGDFAVAVRSALLRGGEATLFAGAGVVAGSRPLAELAETELKFRPLLAALFDYESEAAAPVGEPDFRPLRRSEAAAVAAR